MTERYTKLTSTLSMRKHGEMMPTLRKLLAKHEEWLLLLVEHRRQLQRLQLEEESLQSRSNSETGSSLLSFQRKMLKRSLEALLENCTEQAGQAWKLLDYLEEAFASLEDEEKKHRHVFGEKE